MFEEIKRYFCKKEEQKPQGSAHSYVKDILDTSYGDIFFNFDLFQVVSIDRTPIGNTFVKFVDTTMPIVNGSSSRINSTSFKTSTGQHNEFVAEYRDWLEAEEVIETT